MRFSHLPHFSSPNGVLRVVLTGAKVSVLARPRTISVCLPSCTGLVVETQQRTRTSRHPNPRQTGQEPRWFVTRGFTCQFSIYKPLLFSTAKRRTTKRRTAFVFLALHRLQEIALANTPSPGSSRTLGNFLPPLQADNGIIFRTREVFALFMHRYGLGRVFE